MYQWGLLTNMIKQVFYFLFILFIFFGFLTSIVEYSGLSEFIVFGLGLPVGLILLLANKNKILSYLNSDAWTMSRKKNGIATIDYFSFNPFSPSPKMSEISYKDGKIDGLCIQWYKNGKKELEENYKDGKLDGIGIRWYENGQIMQEINYKDGQEDGKVTQWYENGQKVGEGNAKDGKQDGKQTLWDENGQIEAEATFKDGECISGDCDYFKDL